MQKLNNFLGIILVSMLVFMVAPGAYAQQYSPAVFVVDQDVVDGQVVVARAVINGPGWIVIHADANGAPGPVIGYAALASGINADVAVTVDTARVTDVLYAMLNVDEGKVGTYEFPGPDAPLMLNDAPVTLAFKVTGTSLTIIGTAMLSDGFKTLVAAVKAADLEKQLRGTGPFTLFAPTDAAFAALPKGKLAELMADPAALKALLLYHVVPGKVMADDVTDGMETATVEGAKVKFSLSDGKVLINDATITAKNLTAHNGVIHVIDKVLTLPEPAEVTGQAVTASDAVTETAPTTTTVVMSDTQATTETQAMTATTAQASPALSGKDIVDTVAENGSFNTLLAAAKTAGLVDTLKGAGPFTVFAPTDAAFAALPAGTLDKLMADPELLKQVLLYHVAAGKIVADEFSDRLLVKSQQGDFIKFTVTDGKVRVNDANIVKTDIDAANGVIHVIDSVLVPRAVLEALAPKVEASASSTVTETQAMTPTEAVTPTESMTETNAMTETQATNAGQSGSPPEPTATSEPTATVGSQEAPVAATPQKMPETGGSFSSTSATLPAVLLVMLVLAAAAFVTRQRPA